MKRLVFIILMILNQNIFSFETKELTPPDVEFHIVDKTIPQNLGDVNIATYFEENLVSNNNFLYQRNPSVPVDFYDSFTKISPRARFLAKTLFRTVILGYDDISPAKVINNCIFNIKISETSHEKCKMLGNVPEIFLENTALSKISVVMYQDYVPKDLMKGSQIIYFSDFYKTSMICDRSILWLLKTFLIDKGYIAIDIKTGQTRYIPMVYNQEKFDAFVLAYSKIITSIPKISLIPFKEPKYYMLIKISYNVPPIYGMSQDFLDTAKNIYKNLRSPISFHLTDPKTGNTELIIFTEKYEYVPFVLNLDYINF